MRLFKKRSERYITRIEYASGEGGFYWVRFLKTKRRTHIKQKSFPDLKCGGKGKAHAAAKKWRDEMEAELNLQNAEYPMFKRYKKKSHSNTGVTGVCRLDYVRGCGRHDTSYSVQWTQTEGTERVVRTRIFGFKSDIEGSEKLALKRAIAHRKKMEKQHYIGAA